MPTTKSILIFKFFIPSVVSIHYWRILAFILQKSEYERIPHKQILPSGTEWA